MRFPLAAVLAFVATSAFAAADPRTVPTKLEPAWQAKTRALFKQAIEIPSVHNRGASRSSNERKQHRERKTHV